MRVLLINQYYYPDIAATAQLCQDWAEDLVRLGHEVTVLAGTGRYRVAHRGERAEPQVRLPQRETHNGVAIVRVPVLDDKSGLLGFMAKGPLGRLLVRGGGYASFFGGALRALFTIERPEIVVALSTPPMVAALGLGAQAALGAQFVYWVQDVYPELLIALGVLKPSSPVARGLAALAALLYRRADRVIALDEAMADRLVAAGADPRRVRVIDHFADTQEITPLRTAASPPADDAGGPRVGGEEQKPLGTAAPPSEINPIRQRLGLGEAFVVCYAGNHGRCHDFATLLAALRRQAADGDRSLHWLFIGDGEQRQYLRSSVPAELSGVVHFLPPQARAELRAVLTAGSVGLVTLKAELSGLIAPSKVYGLLAAGCPIVYVGPRRGRIPELLSAEPVGVAVDNDDAAGLLAALRRLQADRPRRAAMAARARQVAVARYDRARITSAHAALLQEVAAAHPARPS